ncbi:MAG: YhfC family intramembrane metalloprotease [Agathobacter sp.]|nr:YhfC family intramembrane metalloprotease [Agathobacter sp.]
MNLGTVSVASIAGMAVSVLISIGLPIFLMFYVKYRTKAKVQFFFIGGAMFIISALMLEQLCHALVFGLTKGTIQDHIWLYALYGGLAAAVFEETGRLIAMKYFMKHRKLTMDNANAFMYGIGHGGAESILIVGMACINNLTTAIMLNTGSLETSINALEGEAKEQAVAGIGQLVEAAPVSFYFAGVERILAIALQIALTILVYQAVKHGKKQYTLLAYGAHFLVDFVAVAASNFLPVISVECLIAAMTAAVGVFTYQIWQKNEKETA